MVFFQAALLGAPRVSDPERAALGMARLRERSEAAGLAEWARQLQDDPIARPLLEGVFANSPFLTACALADVPFLRRVLTDGPDATVGGINDDLKDRVSRELDEDRLQRELRIAKRRVALAVALADLTGHWLLERVTHALSDFADVAVSTAISHLLLREAAKGDLVLPDESFPEDDCGYVAIAMGKHGARELNYSSDIDLIVLYDPVKVDYRGRRTPGEAFVRMTQRLMSILQTRTADGYVFRVDLNLRPDPRSTPVAIPVAAARTYYATRGQSWERAAMIKARSAAGDVALGVSFLAELEPFVWRDQLDFWMIRDIRAIKRRLYAERGGADVAFHGHNVKLGRGGIREIEFFAQTQQLILGGRDPYLRCLRTVEALTTLAESGAIEEEVTDELTEAYELLRQLEHRLQMVDDQQTQTLPDSDAGMRLIAAFMGYDDLEAFRETVLHHLRRVEAHYAAFFDDARLAAEPAGDDLDLDRDPIRRWRDGGLALPELIPVFVEAAAARPDPDEALALLDGALSRWKDGGRSLALLSANRPLVELLLDVVTTAPAVTADLCAWPERLEGAVASLFWLPLPVRKVLVAECARSLRGRPELDALARWASEHRFQIAAHVLRQTMTAAAAGQAASDVADVVLEQLWRRAVAEGGPGIVLACGSYGARELTLSSPLSLVFVADGDELARRVIEGLAAPTAHGRLYEVAALQLGLDALADPSLSPRLLMDLAAARVVCGPEDTVARWNAALGARLQAGVDARALAGEIARARRDANAGARGPWDVRRRRGGLDDLDALVQLVLAAPGAPAPPILAPGARRLLRQVENLLGAALGPEADVESSPRALRLLLCRVGDAASVSELRAAVDAVAETIGTALSAQLVSG